MGRCQSRSIFILYSMDKTSDIFCEIIAGLRPAHKWGETENFLAILDIEPFSPGHTLIISKSHINNLEDLAYKHELIDFASDITRALKKAFGYEAVVLLANSGQSIQDIPHLHVHIYGTPKPANGANSSLEEAAILLAKNLDG